jgi:hypothetical protein
MKTRTLIKALMLTTALSLTAGLANAECYADYKAKQDNPLRLHYGVIQLMDENCNRRKLARAEIMPRIGIDGWVLLQIQDFFGPEGLEQRRESAGEYFLRY